MLFPSPNSDLILENFDHLRIWSKHVLSMYNTSTIMVHLEVKNLNLENRV